MTNDDHGELRFNGANGKEPDRSTDNDAPGNDPGYRVKDQFGSLDAIEPARKNGTGTPRDDKSKDADSFRVSDHPVDAHAPSSPRSPGGRPSLPGEQERQRSFEPVRREFNMQDYFKSLDILKILRGVYRRFWITIVSAFAMLLLLIPAGRALRGDASYSARATIIYTSPQQKHVPVAEATYTLRPISPETLMDMVIGPQVIVALEQETGFTDLAKRTSLQSQRRSDINTLVIEGMPSEQAAINTVNRLAQLAIEHNARYYRQLASASFDSFRVQRQAAEQAFREAVRAVEEFQLRNQILELSTQYQNYFAAVAAAQERLSIGRLAHDGLLVRIRDFEAMIAELPDEVLDTSREDNPLKRRIANAEAALLESRTRFAADNPNILRQERELEEMRRLLQSGTFDETRERTFVANPLKAQLRSELLRLRTEENVSAQQLRAQEEGLAELRSQFQELPRLEKEYVELLDRRAQASAAFRLLQANEESARQTMLNAEADFKLLNQAARAEMTGGSLLGKVVPVAGMMFGFMGSLLLLLGLELIDARFRTQQQVQKAYDAPCLTSIIEIPSLRENNPFNLLLPSLRELFDRLNTVLQGRPAKTLGFISSQDDEGKSTLCFNLARYCTSLGLRTLYVGFDPRPNPCLPTDSSTGWPQLGIESYLLDQASFDDLKVEVEGVTVLRVRQDRPDLLELIKGSAMRRLWDLLQDEYDLILSDIPAVLDHPVGGAVAALQDELIYLIASPVSDRRIADAGLEYLEDRGMAPLAMIFNRVDPYYLDDIRQQRMIRALEQPKTAWWIRLQGMGRSMVSTATSLKKELRQRTDRTPPDPEEDKPKGDPNE